MIPEACTHILYMAADTVRERTVFEFLEFHATWIGCAVAINFFNFQLRQSKRPY